MDMLANDNARTTFSGHTLNQERMVWLVTTDVFSNLCFLCLILSLTLAPFCTHTMTPTSPPTPRHGQRFQIPPMQSMYTKSNPAPPSATPIRISGVGAHPMQWKTETAGSLGTYIIHTCTLLIIYCNYDNNWKM